MGFFSFLKKWFPGCPCREELCEYALVGLPEEERSRAEAHLRNCPRCREQVKEYALLSEGLALSTRQFAPREGFAEAIFRGCLEEKQAELTQALRASLSLCMNRQAMAAILDHVRASYPHECCGLLVGKAGKSGSFEVEWHESAPNLNKERAADRYLLDPAIQLKVEKKARAQGQEVLGFYHSHPNHPAIPSETDRELSWHGYHYLIVSIQPGGETVSRCWQRKDKDSMEFEEVEIVIL